MDTAKQLAAMVEQLALVWVPPSERATWRGTLDKQQNAQRDVAALQNVVHSGT